jgi:amino acid transporter
MCSPAFELHPLCLKNSLIFTLAMADKAEVMYGGLESLKEHISSETRPSRAGPSRFIAHQRLRSFSNTTLPILYSNDPSSSSESSIETAKLPAKSLLSPSTTYLLLLSSTIGSGIFAAPGSILQSTGSPGLALSLWILGALLAWCGLSVSIELGCSYFSGLSGGHNVYLLRMFGEKPKFLTATILAVQAAVLGFSASNSVVFGQYVCWTFGLKSSVWGKVFGASLVFLVSLVHGRWRRGGIAMQNFLGWIKVGVILFVTITAFGLLLTRGWYSIQAPKPSQSTTTLWKFLWADSNFEFSSLASAFFKVSWAFAGYDNVNNVLGEVRNPTKTLRTVAPLGMLSVVVFYLLLNIAYFVAVPIKEAKESGELIAALFFERVLGQGVGNGVLGVLIALSAAGNVMVTTFSQVRLTPGTNKLIM